MKHGQCARCVELAAEVVALRHAQGAPDYAKMSVDMAIEACAKVADAECLKHTDWAKMAEHVLSDHVAACKQIASMQTAQEIAELIRALPASAVTSTPGQAIEKTDGGAS